MDTLQNKIQQYIIDYEDTLINTLKKMDEEACKLLLVFKSGKFESIISIGDIQRCLLKENDFNTKVHAILSEKIIGHTYQTKDEIKALMFDYRAEFMPVVNDEGELVDVLFWKELFETKKVYQKMPNNIPVVIMAGGKGERLKPITNIIPKPLVPIGDKAFIQIIMDSFKQHEVNNFHLSVNYKADMIEHYFNPLKTAYNIAYYNESKPLGTAGSLHLMKDKINTTFFVSNCDILIDQDYAEILKYHQEHENELTAVAAVKTYSIPYGTMEIGKDGLLEELKEKPNPTYYINAGLYILEPHLLKEIPENELFHITHLMEMIKNRNGKVGVFPVSEGAWMDIGEWNEYNLTQERFKNRFK